MAEPSGWDMSVTAARAGRPHVDANRTHADASSAAASGVFMNAPLPAFTSSRMRSVPTASFFDITLAAMREMLSTVAVASRSAYSAPSAGTRSLDCPATAQPISSTWRSSCSGERPVRRPGIDSSLSSVPPVCPKPRPESFATASPREAASGANTRVTPSLTPPVECLSTLGRLTRESGRVAPDSIIARVSSAVSPSERPFT